ncbi:MAG: hypothetical protein WCG85_25750 [Polyangia bacterium]
MAVAVVVCVAVADGVLVGVLVAVTDPALVGVVLPVLVAFGEAVPDEVPELVDVDVARLAVVVWKLVPEGVLVDVSLPVALAEPVPEEVLD